ncbi:MAG: hypothetical protein IJY94_05455 [Clostridia bacterium]|nr:hypothetical protein [Clostridia bacterium]
MENEKNNSLFLEKDNVGQSVSPSTSPSVRRSFKDEIGAVANQLELYAVREMDKPFAYELCAIIAEVNLMRPEFRVKIGGEVLEAGLVTEVFACLTHDHLERVMDSFNTCVSEIRNKKAYLRTALYNSVFELEAGTINDVNWIG